MVACVGRNHKTCSDWWCTWWGLLWTLSFVHRPPSLFSCLSLLFSLFSSLVVSSFLAFRCWFSSLLLNQYQSIQPNPSLHLGRLLLTLAFTPAFCFVSLDAAATNATETTATTDTATAVSSSNPHPFEPTHLYSKLTRTRFEQCGVHVPSKRP